MDIQVEFLTAEEERTLAKQALAGDIDARNRVVLNVYPWILKTAMKYAGRVPHEDIVQHALQLCMEKFHLFDPSLRYKPMTYLCTIAERQMQVMTQHEGVIKGPRTHTLTNEKCRERTRQRAEAAKKIRSFSYPVAGREGSFDEFGNTIPDDKTLRPDEEAVRREEDERFFCWLQILPAKERKIIHLRVVEELTLREVGVKVGLTRERVRQIQERGMEKLRKWMEEGRPIPERKKESRLKMVCCQ
jgi:RNA polymerase sigma factor (sigma-70 family)